MLRIFFPRLSLFPPQNPNPDHILNPNLFRARAPYSPMASSRVIAEYAKSNRSSCKKCGKYIVSGSLRLGLSSKDPRGFNIVKWHHLNCFSIKDRTFKAVNEIKGFSCLKGCDLDALKKLEAGEDHQRDRPETDGVERSTKKTKVHDRASVGNEECKQKCLEEVKANDGASSGAEECGLKCLAEFEQSGDGVKNVLKIAFSVSDIRKTYKDATLPPNWKSFKTVIFREREDGLRDSEKIAAFDFDGCLVNTSVKRIGADAWSLMYPSVPENLQGLYGSGYKLVIFTNESNIERWKNKRQQAVDSKVGRLENFISRVQRPFQVFIACGLGKNKDQIEDPFRKPKPGMWRLMEEHFNSGIAIDMDQSFYVGNAAGRINDHSDADTRFAQTIGLKFHVPEKFFEA